MACIDTSHQLAILVCMTELERIELLAKIQEFINAIYLDEQEMKRTHDLLLSAGGYTWVPKKKEVAQELAGQTADRTV